MNTSKYSQLFGQYMPMDIANHCIRPYLGLGEAVVRWFHQRVMDEFCFRREDVEWCYLAEYWGMKYQLIMIPYQLGIHLAANNTDARFFVSWRKMMLKKPFVKELKNNEVFFSKYPNYKR